MEYSYDVYYINCFETPFCTTLFFGVLFILVNILFVRSIIGNKATSDLLFRYIIVTLILVVCLSVSIGQLAHGGWHLVSEKESDAVQISGEIQSIHELDKFSFPYIGSDDRYYKNSGPNGVMVTVNGVKCTTIEKGDFEVGDRVTITYLPRSGYVLSIEKLGQQNITIPDD